MTGLVMITGAAGQLGHELRRTVPAGVAVVAVDIDQLDLTDASAVDSFVASHCPHVIINAAAFTAVERAESHVDAAYAVNTTAARSLAIAAAQQSARLIQISTDFVFGASNGHPRKPQDLTDPWSVYGRTKRDGELGVLEVLDTNALIIRTAWLYSAHGGNFVKTMLRLMAERDEIGVIDDQVGSPTWANSLARTIWAAVDRPHVSGVLHWTDAGVASWYDFAVAIQEEAVARRLLNRSVPVHAIPTSAYPTPAARPAYSVLDKHDAKVLLDTTPVHWRINLRHMLDELANA